MKQIILILLLLPCIALSQDTLNGIVFEANDSNKEIPLPGANVYWLGTTVGAVTDFEGKFVINYKKEYRKLVISYVGFTTDTITIEQPKYLRHWLTPSSNLDEITLEGRKKASATSYLASENLINISSEELLKAACCNLSESFETNPSIDVNFSDAISGTKQIKMLGLTSPYILITTENIPSIRGASQTFGLTFIPGTWVESIQITKGAGSVVNGFESIAGQINAELQKPTLDDKLFVNLYGSINGRLELNTHLNTDVTDKWSTGLYIHGNLRDQKFDNNDDSFLDMPLTKQLNLFNRWQYTDTKNGLVSFLNFRFLTDEKQTGQLDFDPGTDKMTTNVWGSEINTRRIETSAKLGYVNPEIPYQSLGVQFSYSHHDQDSYFGLRTYEILHNSVYANVVYNSIISDSRHKVKTGASYTFDQYDELVETTSYGRTEMSFGGFFEYSFDNLEAINLTAGIRIDYHNLMGTFITPRFHIRYAPWEKSALRASFGRGKRSANIFAENQRMFATSRTINVLNTDGEIYGLDPEIAWNYGVSYLQGFDLFNRKADLTIDFYRTNFENQVIIDFETPTQVNIYNLDGVSYANSFQVEFNYNAFEGFDLRTAYKYYDIQTDYIPGRLEKPLTPSHRVFANASYQTPIKNNSRWKFDATYNWLGEQRFSSTDGNPIQYQLPEYSDTVATLNGQITRVFSPKFELYLGGENIANVKQPNPIVSADNPFGAYFDSTQVYGPIFGSMYYAGLRLKIN